MSYCGRRQQHSDNITKLRLHSAEWTTLENVGYSEEPRFMIGYSDGKASIWGKEHENMNTSIPV